MYEFMKVQGLEQHERDTWERKSEGGNLINGDAGSESQTPHSIFFLCLTPLMGWA